MINPEADTITLPTAFLAELSSADSLETVLRVSSVWLTRLLPAERGAAVFMHGETVRSSAYWADERVDPLDSADMTPRAGSIRAQVMRSQRTVTLNNVEISQHQDPVIQRLYDAGLRNLMQVPMMTRNHAVGMLSVGGFQSDGFASDHAEILNILGQIIAAQLLLMEQLRQTARRAETDPLTGLANRARLMRVLAQNKANADSSPATDETGQTLGLLHLDLDRFKDINDRLGHAAGDAVLTQAADRMRSVLGPRDIAARVGGDEFVVLTRSDPRGTALNALGNRLLNALSAPMDADGTEIEVTASIGGAVATKCRHQGVDLIADADIALYEVKRSGRAGVRIFDRQMRAFTESRESLLRELKEFGTEDAFIPYFQPLVSFKTGRFVGFEMLARWMHPQRGALNPAEFMDIVQEAGLTQQLDETVRRKGLSVLRDLKSAGWSAPRMSFNAAPSTLQNPDIVEILLDELFQFKLGPQDLAIELREVDIIALGRPVALQQLTALGEAGFRVELDDFGAGGSACIELLSTLPLSGLKLDPNMVQLIPEAPKSDHILDTLIKFAKMLDQPVVAKGVETAEQFAKLRALGCTHAQGNGISPALSVDALERFMSGYGKAPVLLAQHP